MNCYPIRQSISHVGLALILTAVFTSSALAGPREQAKRMHDRLVGVPPSAAVLNSMAASIAAGDPVGAANQAMTNSFFYTSTLKNFVTPWTNVEQTVYEDLNDYTATVIGIVRDDRPFTQVLSGNLVYVGAPGVVSAGYSQTDNAHYLELQENAVDLSNPALFRAVAQSTLPGSVLGRRRHGRPTPEGEHGSRSPGLAGIRRGPDPADPLGRVCESGPRPERQHLPEGCLGLAHVAEGDRRRGVLRRTTRLLRSDDGQVRSHRRSSTRDGEGFQSRALDLLLPVAGQTRMP